MRSQAFIASSRARGTKLSSLAAIVAAAENLLDQRHRCDRPWGRGEPDFPTPENIKAAAKRALDGNFTRYTAVSGTFALKEAICARVASDFGADYTPAQCSVTVGGKQAIFNSVVSLIDPGDEVLMEKPCWVSFPEIVNFARGKSSDSKPSRPIFTSPPIRSARRSPRALSS